MIKIYKAATEVSFNVNLDDNRTRRIRFELQSLGNSIYITKDKEIQDALERHRMFGRLFSLHSSEHTVEDAEPQPIQTETTIEVACLEDAKQWLIDNLGAPRRRLRTPKEVVRYAQDSGITFVGNLE